MAKSHIYFRSWESAGDVWMICVNVPPEPPPHQCCYLTYPVTASSCIPAQHKFIWVFMEILDKKWNAGSCEASGKEKAIVCGQD